MSGVSHQGADVGGFTGVAPSAELFLRWVQHGVFTPRFSIHSANEDNTVCTWRHTVFRMLSLLSATGDADHPSQALKLLRGFQLFLCICER